jgi:homoserine kinase type II
MSDQPPAEVLRAWGFEGAAVTEFDRGLVNTHWLAERGQERIVVRRYNRARSSPAVKWEQALVRQAASEGWPVPVTLATSDGGTLFESEGQLWSASRFLRGAPDLQPSVAAWRRRGELLARLHRDLAGFASAGQRPSFGTDFQLGLKLLAHGIVATFEEAVDALAQEHPDLAAVATARRAENVEALERLRCSELPMLPVHADFQRFNLLWSEDELTGLLDFDFSHLDVQVQDLAIVLIPFMPLERDEASAVIEGYESIRELTRQERLLLPVLVRTHLIWWVTHLLTGWLAGDRASTIPGIRRTLTVRLPAFDAAEDAWRVFLRTS